MIAVAKIDTTTSTQKITNIALCITSDEVESSNKGYPLSVVKSNNVRSSVYDKEGHLIAFAPLCSNNVDGYFDNYGELKEGISVQQYVEGTMINIFHYNGEWKVATKSSIGGKNSFYINGQDRQTSFGKMFHECCRDVNLKLEYLNPRFSYSFVMQHTDNRIINHVEKNRLYLIALYVRSDESYPKSVNMLKSPRENCDTWLLVKDSNINIEYPEEFNISTRQEIIDRFASPYTNYDIMGVNLFNNITGERTKFRNPCFEELKKLRGNQAKIEFHYHTLRKNGQIDEFLDFFPEHRENFCMFECKRINFIHELHNNYQKCYMQREKPLRNYGNQYRNHMYTIHEDYLKNRTYTTMDVVDNYVCQLPEALLLGSINYDFRKPIQA